MRITSRLQKLFAVGLMCASAMAAADHHHGATKIGGYIDAQYRMNRGGLDLHSTNKAGTRNTFSVYQGAVQFAHEMGMASLMIDLAFMQRGQTASNASSTGNNSFAVANQFTQAYVMQKYDSGLSWKLGQFDTIYGIDAVDVINTPVNSPSFNKLLTPFTHTGILVGYKMGDIGVNVHYGNSNQNTPEGAETNNGQAITDTDDAAKPEYGLQVTFANDMINAKLGYKVQGYEGKVGTNDLGNETTIDLGVGAMFGAFGVDLAFTQVSNIRGMEKMGTDDTEAISNILLQFKYALNETHGFTLRYETLDHMDPLAGAARTYSKDFKAQDIALAYSHKCNDNMSLKVDIHSTSYEDVNGAVTKDDSALTGAVSAAYRF